MAAIAHGVGALLFIDMAHIAGLVAAGVHPSPFPHADIVTTTTHKTLRGPRGGLVFSRRELPDGRRPRPTSRPSRAPLAASVDKTVFPGHPGRAADARHRGQGRRVQAGRRARRSARTSGGRSRTPRSSPRPSPARAPGSSRAARTTTSLLVDVTPLGVTGKEAEHLLDEVGITVNKNAIPFDPLPPNTASGIRVGTPATTSRGFGPDEMRAIGRIIIEAIRDRDDAAARRRLAGEVREIVVRFPVPGLTAA